MPDPSHLPLELFDRVVGFAIEKTDDVKSLCCFTLVSKHWKGILQHRIYSKWLYDGEYHSITSLWKFLRTILGSRQLADKLDNLTIRAWTLGLVHSDNPLNFCDSDLDVLRNAIRMAGLQRLETSFTEALQKTDPRPFMALLLAHARNLKVLYAEVPETDIFFEEVLRKAMGHQQHRAQDEYCPLHYLQEAHLTSSWNCRRGSQSRDNYKLALSHLSLVFQLPSIQKLSLFDFVSCGASNWIENNSKPSSLRDLTIVHHRDCVLEASDAKALLVLPRTLTKLSIYLDDQIDNRPLPSNADLWNVISQHNQSIEYLDVYRDSEALGGKNSHFGSMKGFKRLHTLYIQPEVLLGSYYGDPTGALQLVDTLPINLRSLTVYGEEGLSTNKTLVWRLQDVVNSRDFPHLSHVVLESTCEYIHHYKDAADPLHDEVERACKESGITYETKDVSSLTHGGVAHPHYKNTEKKRLQMDIKMDEVRVVITEHLHRLRRATSGDAGNTDTQEKFTTDDLDSYELPWEELYQSALSLDLGIFSDAGSICDGRSSYEEHPEESMPDFLEDSDIEDMESQDTDPQ